MCCTLTVRKKKQTKARKRPGRINKAKIIIKEKEKKKEIWRPCSLSPSSLLRLPGFLFFSLSLSAVAQIYPPTEYYTQTVVYQDCCIISPNGSLCMRGCCCCYFLLQVLLRHNGICFQINETPFIFSLYRVGTRDAKVPAQQLLTTKQHT